MKTLEQTLDSDFFKVLSEPARIALIRHLLRLGRADVSTLASHMSQDRSVVSRHLKALRQAQLVSCEKQGKHSSYCLNGKAFVDRLENLLETVKAAVQQDCC